VGGDFKQPLALSMQRLQSHWQDQIQEEMETVESATDY
jgi:hypothetical protein